ncbi:hypothetical protein lerEdw1_009228 [Lerista edwardsae]|nr:hypothetical protein lerEdw1_009229 [Lerista edwardsae]KAJ6650415.1 hypothetical protein lerEdw1_009228 [Lerista edwardsae]
MQEQPSEKSERIEANKEESERREDTTTREPVESLSRWNRNLDEEDEERDDNEEEKEPRVSGVCTFIWSAL